MVVNEFSLILLQYSGSAGGRQYGAMPMIGIAIGIVAGMVAAANGRSAGRWASLVGAVCFAVAWAVNQPEGFDIGAGHFQQPLFMQVMLGAVQGAFWCGLWGLLGGKWGRKMNAANSDPLSPGTPPERDSNLADEKN